MTKMHKSVTSSTRCCVYLTVMYVSHMSRMAQICRRKKSKINEHSL